MQRVDDRHDNGLHFDVAVLVAGNCRPPPYPREKQIDQVRDGALNHTTTPVEWISLKTSGYL
jgi:hypothetical protein